MSRVKLTQETFLIRAKNQHGIKYDYKDTIFTGVNNIVKIICPIHGEFEQMAMSHLIGCGCSKCSFDKIHEGRKSNTDEFIKIAKLKHGDKYDYSLVNYINNTTKVKIICPIHGEFEQPPHHHKRGGECKKCANIKTGKAAIDNSRGWSLSDWENKIKKNPNAIPKLYVIKCFDKKETFIKIGITMRTIEKRFANKKLMPYNYEVLFILEEKASVVFNLEIELKKLFKAEKYTPKLKFCGSRECFNVSQTEKLINLIKQKFANIG